jgi:hypothetical protein
MGLKKVRIANLPPEVPNSTVRDTLAQYGEVREITEHQLTKAYRYHVSNGIRIVGMSLRKHLPSHMNIVNNRVLVSYEGIPATCYGCGETGHQYHECPERKPIPNNDEVTSPNAWADIVARTADKPGPSVMVETQTYDPCTERTETPGEMARDTYTRHSNDSPHGELGQDPVHVSETPTGGDVQGATQPSQRVVKWSETPVLPFGDVVQDVTEGPYGQQGHTPQPSETGGPIPCGVDGEAFDSSNCTMEETLDVTTDNPNLSDEDILPRP